jgi:membrane protein YqaA with SNARE-associated domain
MEFLHGLTGWIMGWADSPYALAALFALAFAESSFFPIPPDVLMIALAITRPPLALFYAAITTAGSVIGGVAGYHLGVKGGRPLLLRLVKHERLHLVEYLYKRYDVWAVGLSAFGPIPYKVFTISAGVFLLDFRRFFLASFLGRAGRFFLVGMLITLFGRSVQAFIENYLEAALLIFFVLLVGGVWFLHFITRRLHRQIHHG